MTDAIAEAAEFEHQLPTAYAQGFARVRIVSVINPDHPGPLGLDRDSLEAVRAAQDAAEPAASVLE
jgi:hypothetical protein